MPISIREYLRLSSAGGLGGSGGGGVTVNPVLTAITGDVPAMRLRFGTYETIDVSGITGDVILFQSDIPTVLMSRGTGMLALSGLVADQKDIGVSMTSAGGAANIAGTAFDFGVGSGFIEAWATIESASGSGITADRHLLNVGTPTQTVILIVCNIVGSNTQTWKAQIKADDGTELWALADATYDSHSLFGGPSTRPIHVQLLWTRSGDTLTLSLRLNGQLVIIPTGKTVAGSAAKGVNLSAITVGGGGIYVGNRGAHTANGWPGRVYTVRAYKGFTPTELQMASRNRQGPLFLPENNKPSWYIDFQNRSTWANPNQPEAYDGTTGTKLSTFNANGSALNLDSQLVAYPGGEFPGGDVGGRGWAIPSNSLTMLAKPANGKLVVYADSSVDGMVRVTGAA